MTAQSYPYSLLAYKEETTSKKKSLESSDAKVPVQPPMATGVRVALPLPGTATAGVTTLGMVAARASSTMAQLTPSALLTMARFFLSIAYIMAVVAS